MTASEWSQSVIILSKVEGSLLDTSIHQPQRQAFVCVCGVCVLAQSLHCMCVCTF